VLYTRKIKDKIFLNVVGFLKKISGYIFYLNCPKKCKLKCTKINEIFHIQATEVLLEEATERKPFKVIPWECSP